MDVAAQLDRIFPVPLQEADLSVAENKFFSFMAGLSKEQYETALSLLPDKPKLEFEDTEQTYDLYLLPDYNNTSVKQVFWDVIAQYAIIIYHNHVSTTEIFAHLLGRKKAKHGTGLRELADKLSSTERYGLFRDLLSLEEKDEKGRPVTQGEFEDYLEELFGSYRIGMVEAGLEELLDTFTNTKKKNKTRSTITGRLERFILLHIQKRRRTEFTIRLGQIDNVNKARFAMEEVHRELYVYRSFDTKHVIDLLFRIHSWYDKSKARQQVLKNPSVMHYSYFFDETIGLARRIGLAVSNVVTDISDFLRPQWEYVIAKFLPSENFWQSMQGLNGEVPLEQTEAGRNIASYRRWALVAGAVYLAVVLLPGAVAVGARAPGAVAAALRWTSGRLLLGTQYAYTTVKVFGLSAGAQRILIDIYHVYLRNPVTINQAINTVTEISLDLTMGGTGLAPGSSPADLSGAALEKAGNLARKGITKMADEALDVARGPHDEIQVVELIVKDKVDGNFYRVTTEIKGGNESVVHLKLNKYENLGQYVDIDSQKTIKFHSRPKNDNSLADARGTAQNGTNVQQTTAANDNVDLLELKGTGTDRPVVTMGPRTTGISKPVVGRTISNRTVNRNASPNDRGVSNKGTTGSTKRLASIPADPVIEQSKAGYSIVADLNAPQLEPLKNAGFKIEMISAKSQKTGGGRFQKHGTGIDTEWKITAPSGVKADVDGLAIDPLKPGGLVSIEAKATFVDSAEKSAHLVFYPKKVEQLTRQLAVALESKGVMRIEILCNADSVAETYLNTAAQQMALDLRKRFRQQAKAFIESTTDKTVRRISLKDLEQIVDENVSVVVSHWGRIKASK